MRNLSVPQLCELMRYLRLPFCATVFKEEGVTGAELMETSKEECEALLTKHGKDKLRTITLAFRPLLSFTCAQVT